MPVSRRPQAAIFIIILNQLNVEHHTAAGNWFPYFIAWNNRNIWKSEEWWNCRRQWKFFYLLFPILWRKYDTQGKVLLRKMWHNNDVFCLILPASLNVNHFCRSQMSPGFMYTYRISRWLAMGINYSNPKRWFIMLFNLVRCTINFQMHFMKNTL